MTDQELRIVIAEACGWTRIHNANTIAPGGVWYGYPPTGAIIGKPERLPDYPNDLNAMHSAEQTLEGTTKAADYCAELGAVILRHAGLSTDGFCGEWRKVNATAGQRAEAFGRIIGKWKE